MIEKFLKLKQCNPAKLRVIHSAETIASKEWGILEDIINMLRSFKIALKSLCWREAKFLTTEVSFQFIMTKLSENTPLANALKEIKIVIIIPQEDTDCRFI